MRKAFSLLLLLACAAMFCGFATVFSKENAEGKMTVDTPLSIWPAKKLKNGVKAKNPVTFNHQKHGADLGCPTCHHKSPNLKIGDKAARPCFDNGCHGPEAVPAEGGKTIPDSWSMIHDKKTGKCLACHSSDEKAKAAKAPTSCSGCHGGKEE